MDKTNIKYIDYQTNITLDNVKLNIINTLDIKDNIENNIILGSIEIKNDKESIDVINSMLNNNNRLSELDKTIKNELIKNKINKLKKRIGQLQLHSVIKSSDNETKNLLSDVLSSVNNKVETINNILDTKLTPQYEYKYLKYKIKYLSKTIV